MDDTDGRIHFSSNVIRELKSDDEGDEEYGESQNSRVGGTGPAGLPSTKP